MSVRNRFSTSDSDGEDGRTVGSDSIAGLAVVLTALSGSNLGDGEDGARLGAPRCGERRIYSLFRKLLKDTNQTAHPEGHRATLTANIRDKLQSNSWLFRNVTLELNRIVKMLTLCRATVQSQAVPCEIIHSGVGLTAAHQGQRSTRIHHTGGVSQHGGVLRRVWRHRMIVKMMRLWRFN